MLFRSLLLCGLAAVRALGAPIESGVTGVDVVATTQDMTALQVTFDQMFTSIDATISKLRKFDGNAAGISAIMTDTSSLQKAVAEGATRIKNSPSMSFPDLLSILGPVEVLESKMTEFIHHLGLRKAEIKKAGAGPQVLQSLKDIKSVADGLATAITGNLPLPAVLGVVASPIAGFITAKLDKGIAEWS